MNKIELMNLAMEFLPLNSKVIDIDFENNGYRGEEAETIVIEYVFRAGEYTMILEKDYDKWYIKEIFDCFQNSNNMMRYEKKPMIAPPSKTPIKIVPKDNLIGTTINKENTMGISTNKTIDKYNDDSDNYIESYTGNMSGEITSKQGSFQEENGSVGSIVGSGSGFTKDKKIILGCVEGDVSGSKERLRVCIVAEQYEMDDKLAQQLFLTVSQPGGALVGKVKLDIDYGFSPNIGLYDFTGNGVLDILVSMRSGGSGGYYFYYIFSYIDREFKMIFDWKEFNKKSKFNVTYLDYYKIEVAGGLLNDKYLIDLSYRDKLYLESLYDDNCKLKKPTKGSVSGVVNLYPVTINNNQKFELHIICNIIGVVNQDIVGGVVYIAKWNGKEFAALGERIILFGTSTYDNYGLIDIDPNYHFLPSYVPNK